eukprot:COSAG02_NODE_52903_length_305_cov_0.737864_1_plen_29_part_10
MVGMPLQSSCRQYTEGISCDIPEMWCPSY